MEATESESEDGNSTSPRCSCPHDGRLLVDEIYSVHIDELFTMLFTTSPFFLDLQEMRKATNVKPGSWCENPDGNKIRVITLTVPLNQTLGPKTCDVIETQVMLPCSEPGLLYSVECKFENKGIPYADSFYITAHFCMVKCSEQKTSLEIYFDVKYTQKVWGFVKTFIDKNSWEGLERTYGNLKEQLRNAIDENTNAPHKRKLRQRRKRRSSSNRRLEDLKGLSPRKDVEKFHVDYSLLIIVGLLFILLIINIYLYYKLWSLDRSISVEYANSFDIRNKASASHESFINELSNIQIQPDDEIENWLEMMLSTINHLRNAEESLSDIISSKISKIDTIE